MNSRLGGWLLRHLVDDAENLVTIEHPSTACPSLSGQSTLVGTLHPDRTMAIGFEKAKPHRRIRVWVLMDFIDDPYDSALIPLLVEYNWQGRVNGEEGWCENCAHTINSYRSFYPLQTRTKQAPITDTPILLFTLIILSYLLQ